MKKSSSSRNCYKESNPNPHTQELREEETMRGSSSLERVVEWLRHFVDTHTFDYCVVWKLGDDPSRFIEWMNCCCGGGGGGYGHHANVKDDETEVLENHISSSLCRDMHLRHVRRTKACEALSCFPSSMPLYSGIHGEVVISKQPRWISPDLDSTPSNESTGTRVLIPVIGGLIELYSGKHIPKDQKIIEFILVQCNVYSEQEAMTIHSSTDFSINETPHIDPFLIPTWPPSFSCSSLAKKQFPPQVTQFAIHRSLEGSSTGSTPSNENSSLESGSAHLSPPLSSNQSIGKYLGSNNPKYNNNSTKQGMGLSSVCGKRVVEKDNVKVIKRSDAKNYQSKNLELERTRRTRIRDGLFALRALVPKISKMDRASILGDAIEHIGELQKEVNELQAELKELDDDCSKSNAEIQGGTKDSPTADHNQGSFKVGKKKQTKVQVEVNQVGTRSFLLKFIYEHKRGGFLRLMEAMNSLGLQVVDVNVTSFDGKVLNILKVQGDSSKAVERLIDEVNRLDNYKICVKSLKRKADGEFSS